MNEIQTQKRTKENIVQSRYVHEVTMGKERNAVRKAKIKHQGIKIQGFCTERNHRLHI